MHVNNLDQVRGPTRLLFIVNRGLFPRRQRGRGMNTTHPYQVPTLTISGTIPLLDFMACTRPALFTIFFSLVEKEQRHATVMGVV